MSSGLCICTVAAAGAQREGLYHDRNDPVEKSIDPNHDPNVFSFYYYSRLDIHLSGGGTFDCEDMREGCPGMVANDGYRGDYSYVAIDRRPDAVR